MNITPSTYLVCHATLKKAGSLLLVLLMLSAAAGAQAAPPSARCDTFGIGDLFLYAENTHVSEIGGLMPCDEDDQTEYDQFTVVQTLHLINSPTLKVVLFNGFVPSLGDRFDILDWGSLNGTFGTIDVCDALLPAPLVWDTSQLHLTGELVVGMDMQYYGDLAPWDDPDGLINAADVLIAEQLVLGHRTPGTLQCAHGDMNSDGDINTADLLLIAREVLMP